MKCEFCESDNTLEVVLEGVSLVLQKNAQKFFSKGLYGPNALVCRDCGRIGRLGFDLQLIEKELRER
jgi:hypothetical protein